MATSNYELPDSTLQLIASSDFAKAFKGFDQNVTPTQTLGALKPDTLIKALRDATKAGPGNPGVNLLANRANGKALKTRDYKDQIFHPEILRMGPYVKPDVVLPKAETQLPYVPPVVPPYVPPFVPEIVDDDVVDDDVVVDDVIKKLGDDVVSDNDDIDEGVPTILTKEIVSDITDDEVDPDTIPIITAPDILETIPSIYTKEIVSDITDDEVDPDTIPLIDALPLDLPDIPEVPELTGVVEIHDGDTIIPDAVGPNRAGGGDLPEEFDKYLVGSGGGGGGGGIWDDDWSSMAYAKGGKVTPNRLMGPDPAGPDDGYAALKSGEFVLNEKTAKEIGYEVLKRLNARNR